MTKDELEKIKDVHIPSLQQVSNKYVCTVDYQHWPCQTIMLVCEIEDLQSTIARLEHGEVGL